MKGFLRFANLFTLAAGAAGMALMAWLQAVGTDEKGLYPTSHPSWILLWILTILVVVALWLLSRQVGINRNYRLNFPASITAAIGYAAAALGLLVSGIGYLRTEGHLWMITGILGIFGAVSIIPGVYARLRQTRSRIPAHILPCFFFAVSLFVLGQEYGAEPEMPRYLYHFWAIVTMVPACYHLWAFDVNMGKRPACIFWCLTAGYCNLVGIAGSANWLLHLCCAVWMLTALPKLCYLPKTPKNPPTQEAPAEEVPVAAEASPALESPLPMDAPNITESPAPTGTLTVQLPDADAILEELLRDFRKQEET